MASDVISNDMDRPEGADGARGGLPERRRRGSTGSGTLTARYAFMLDLNDRLHGLRDADEISGRACEMLGERIEADRVLYAEVEANGEFYNVVSEWVRGDVRKLEPHRRLDEYGEQRVADFKIGRIWRSDDTHDDDLPAEIVARLDADQIRAHVAISIAHAGRVAALFCVNAKVPREWTDAEVEIIAETAVRTSEAVERARVEWQLRLSEQRYSALVHAGASSVWRMSGDGKDLVEVQGDVQANTAHEVRTADDWVQQVHPEDRERSRESWFRAVETKTSYDEIHRVMTPAGYRYLHSRGIPVLDEEGNVREWVGTAVDVTEHIEAEHELRRSESRLRLLTESFTDYAIMTMDTDRVILSWNPGAANIFGYTEEEAIGRMSDMLFTPEDRAANQPEVEMTTARDKGKAADERWHMRKDGSRFYASGIMASLYDGETLIGYAKIARDLTEQKQAEEELRRSREELEIRVEERTKDLNRSNFALREEIRDRRRIEEERVGLLRRIVTTQEDERRRIARDLHDSLGQRLTGLRLTIASLKEQAARSPELLPQIERLEQLGAQLDSEVNFLAWQLRPTALDDLGLVNALQNYVRTWSSQYEVPAEFHNRGVLQRRLDNEVETNLYRITQEALNNIFKHSKATGASVLLEFRDSHVVLIIEDNGIGFDPAAAEPAPREGRGLGLVGMRERAAIVGGSIEIESSPGKGTTLFVRVPAKFVPDNTK